MLDEQALNVVRQHMWEVRAPTAYDRVYKDECVFSFDTPESPGGLYVNLSTFQAVGEMHLDVDFERNGKHLYLHERAKRVPLTEEQLQEHASKPARMAIGGEGGFQVDAKKYNVEREHALVVMPGRLTIPLPCQELPQVVLDVIAGIKEHDSALVQDNVAMWEEERKVSRFAKSLHQEPAWRKLSPNPRDWKCDLTGATENLWLNLSTGVIGSGRANWDGSGGNGAALRHYEEAGRKYPLVVKLGTITPHGADVFSYDPDEDDMVTDPDLDAHLAHWGINMMQMQKTEKTVAELQIDLNLSFELDRITEANCRLHPISGPRLVGLRNLGNSCYMNSVLQALWMVPDLEARYVQAADQIVRTAPQEPQSDFPVQMAKIGVALLHARTAAPLPVEAAAAAAPQDGQQSSSSVEMGEADENGMADATPASHGKTEEAVTADAEANSVVPRMFKKVVGQGHPEFSTAHQQDAMEYFLHLLEVMQRAERAHASRLGTARLSTSDANFRFQTQDRIVCQRTQAVSYKVNAMTVLELSIPLEASVNQPEVAAYQQREQKRQKLRDESAAAYIPSEEEGAATGVISKDSEEEPVIPQVPAQACLDRWAQTEEMSDYYSAAAGGKVTAVKSTRFKTFPPFLMLAMRRYYVDELWVPRKMEVLVQMPDELDLEYLRAAGPQPEEQLQPEEDPAAGPPGAAAGAGGGGGGGEDSKRPIPDDSIVQQLMAMGFSQNGSRRACVACRNSSVEACMEWVLSHMEDADFNSPLEDAAPAPAAPGETGSAAPQGSASEEQVETLAAMGFSKREAQAALTACSCSLERAVDWLFSHADGLEAAVAQVLAGPGADNGSLSGGTSSAAPEMDDGPGQYRLEAIISHMGSNTGCGHYVCHTKKDGKWVLFNDEKVALSEKPPKDLGYLYLYRRCMEH